MTGCLPLIPSYNMIAPVRNIKFPPDCASVVGTIHSPGSLAAARALEPGAVDYLELRVDAFAGSEQGLGELEAAAKELAFPLIVTVRRPDEGGANKLGCSQRERLYHRFLAYAALVDVELRSLEELEPVIRAIRAQGAGVILSYHDFAKTPALEVLRELEREAGRLEGGALFKVAATAPAAADLAVLLSFLTGSAPEGQEKLPMAVMGMGAFGKISRLTLGAAGSRLNYGYLDTVQVSGQWPAEELKVRLAELTGSLG